MDIKIIIFAKNKHSQKVCYNNINSLIIITVK